MHLRNLKQVLKYRLVLKKMHRTVEFNQKAWLKLYNGLNTDIRKIV